MAGITNSFSIRLVVTSGWVTVFTSCIYETENTKMSSIDNIREAKLLSKRQKIREKRERNAENRIIDLRTKAEYNKRRQKKLQSNLNETSCQLAKIPSENVSYSLRNRENTSTSKITDNSASNKKTKSVSNPISTTSTNNNDNISVPDESIVNIQDLTDGRAFEKHDEQFSKQTKKINTLRRREAKLRRKMSKLKQEIRSQNNTVKKWKNKYFRLLRKHTKPDEILDNVKKVEGAGRREVHKNLVQFEVLQKQIRDRQLLLTNEKERSIFTQCLAGKVVRKYKGMRRISPFVSNYSIKKYENSECIKFKRSNTKKKLAKDKIAHRVQKFLEKNENSSIAPGVKDTITKNGVKERKRYLCDSMDNLYLKFKEEEKLNISRSTFYSIKPFWISQRKVTGRDTCLCKSHANMDLFLQKLFQFKILSSLSVTSFVKSRVCDMFSKECFFGECKKCLNKSVISQSSEEPTWYYKWSTQEISRPGAKGLTYNVKVTSKLKVDCTVNQLISEVNTNIPEFLKHVYITTHQHKAIECINEDLKENEVSLVIDYSENYVCKCHQEIQSAHFGASKKQLSLHTGAFFYKVKSTNLNICTSFCSISECLRHDAASVWAHLDPIFKLIKDTVPDVTAVHIQSDGPSTQYKNKTNLHLFMEHCRNEQLHHATWNFTSAGHGKSVADGIGGTVKGLCDRVVAQGSDITTAEDMVNTINSSNSKIQAFLILMSDIESINSKIPNSLKPAPNTLKIFQTIWSKTDINKLFLNQFSCSYCIANKLYDPPCKHFPLQPNSWNFIDSVNSRKRSKVITKQNPISKKKKTDPKVPSEPNTNDSRKQEPKRKETRLSGNVSKKSSAILKKNKTNTTNEVVRVTRNVDSNNKVTKKTKKSASS